jgi:hypothetical protein
MELITPLYNAVVALGAVEFSWVGQLSHYPAPDSSDFTCEYSTKNVIGIHFKKIRQQFPGQVMDWRMTLSRCGRNSFTLSGLLTNFRYDRSWHI